MDSAPSHPLTPTELRSAAPGVVNVLQNDSDPDNDTLQVAWRSQGRLGAGHWVSGGCCTYARGPRPSGTDPFHYTISDGHGHSA